MKSGSPQSLAGAVRQRLASIELRLHHGVRLDVIRRELEADGFPTTALSLRNALYRARARQNAASAAPVGEKAATGGNQDPYQPNARASSGPPRVPTQTNPLLEPKGFVYRGTQGLSKEDLI